MKGSGSRRGFSRSNGVTDDPIPEIGAVCGLFVRSAEIRELQPASVSGFDLLVVGSPVHYYDIPPNVSRWLKSAPSIDGSAVAAYVSFGGPEGNQHNAACSIVELLMRKGGVPVGLGTFMNMGPCRGMSGFMKLRKLKGALYTSQSEFSSSQELPNPE